MKIELKDQVMNAMKTYIPSNSISFEDIEWKYDHIRGFPMHTFFGFIKNKNIKRITVSVEKIEDYTDINVKIYEVNNQFKIIHKVCFEIQADEFILAGRRIITKDMNEDALIMNCES